MTLSEKATSFRSVVFETDRKYFGRSKVIGFPRQNHTVSPELSRAVAVIMSDYDAWDRKVTALERGCPEGDEVQASAIQKYSAGLVTALREQIKAAYAMADAEAAKNE